MLQLEAWARDGLTDEQIAANMGIGYSTLQTWKSKYQDIQDTLKKGKVQHGFKMCSRCVQDDVEPLKALILLGFLMVVQYGQDIFNLRIYKNRK